MLIRRKIRTRAQSLTMNWGSAYWVSWNTADLSQSVDRASLATLYSMGHTKLSNCTSTYDTWTQRKAHNEIHHMYDI